MNKPIPAPRQATHYEPWEIDRTWADNLRKVGVRIENSLGIGICANINETSAERIVSCVNALEGISNPAAVKQLIEAAKLAELYLLNGVTYQGERQEVEQALQSALAALDAPVPKE